MGPKPLAPPPGGGYTQRAMAPLTWRRLLLPALLLAASALAGHAANVERAAPSIGVYPMPTPAWTGSLTPAALAGVPGVDVSKTQQLAPIAFELTHSLGITAEAFAKMPEADRASACALAADQARHDLTQKAYELVGQAKKLAWSTEGMTKADLDALYPLAVKLREIDRNYGSYLGADEKDAVAASAAQTASAWRQARAAYVASFGESTAKALRTGKEAGAGAAVTPAAAKTPKPLNPGTSARKIRERMQGTKSGWGESDMETLYVGYGFAFRDGAKHRMYYHPDFPELHTTVSRQRSLPPGYAQEALKLINELEALSAPAGLPSLAKAQEDDELPPPFAEARAAEKKAPPTRQTLPPMEVAVVSAPLSPVEATVSPVHTPRDLSLSKANPEPARVETPAPKPSSLEHAVFIPVHAELARAPWWRRWLERIEGGKP